MFKSSSFSKTSSTDSTLVNTVNGKTEGLSYTSSAAEIEANDLEAWEGVNLFFQNEFDKAQAKFLKKSDQDFLYALCYGATCLFKAGLTLQDEHINLAIDTLTKAHTKAQQTIDKIQQIEGNTMINSISKAFGGFFSSSSSTSSKSSEKPEIPKISALEFRAQICKAEASLLIGMLQLMLESWTYYMKAVLNLHSGFSVYHSLDKYIDAYADNEEAIPYDKHSLSGYYFGVGTINIVINMLPPKIASLIGAITGKIDAQKGFNYISKSIEVDGLLSILANFQGSMIHLLYFSFCPSFSIPKNIEGLKPYLDPAVEKYPDGFFFRLIMGRRDRALKKLESSNSHYYTIAESKGAWDELASMSNYELSFNHCFALNWESAFELFENLTVRNYWNPTIFTYLQAICQFELGNLEACKQKLQSLETLQTRKFGGKVIAVEAFATTKTKHFLQNYPQNLILPGLEVIALWNGFSSMSTENLEKCKAQALAALETVLALPESTRFEEEALCYYLLGCIDLELHNYPKAIEYLEKTVEFKKKLKLNQYLIPFSYYELACIEFLQANYPSSKAWLVKVKECSGYFFENRLGVRVHLSNIQLRSLC